VLSSLNLNRLVSPLTPPSALPPVSTLTGDRLLSLREGRMIGDCVLVKDGALEFILETVLSWPEDRGLDCPGPCGEFGERTLFLRRRCRPLKEAEVREREVWAACGSVIPHQHGVRFKPITFNHVQQGEDLLGVNVSVISVLGKPLMGRVEPALLRTLYGAL